MTDSTATAILSRLRDAHIPDAPGWWPPAFGWWVLFFTTGLIVGVTLYRHLRRRHQRRCPAWHALNELDELWDDYTDTGDAKLLLERLSTLMRRTAISLSTHDEVAALTGEAWLNWLDQHAPRRLFASADGQLLADAPYRPLADGDMESVFDACEAWLEHNADAYRFPQTPLRRNDGGDGESADEDANKR